MLQGQCFGANESLYLKQRQSPVKDALTLITASSGLLLNILSLTVFLRVLRKPNNRNSFHIFLVFLSACEVAFCLSSGVTYANILNSRTVRNLSWIGLDGDETTTTYFRFSIYLPTENPTLVVLYYHMVVLSAYLSIVSQFARNAWVAITALLRWYVATRRTSVNVSQLYSVRRVSLLFGALLLVVVTLSLIRSCINHAGNIFNWEFHVCNISDWEHPGTLIVHVTKDQEANRRNVNMIWTTLSQIIPWSCIVTSSVLLVHSLRSNSLVDSSERNKRITRMVFIFSMAFTLLESPRAFVFLFNKLLKSVTPTRLLDIYQVTYILSLADSTVNVFIYFFNDQHFKKALCGCSGTDDFGGRCKKSNKNKQPKAGEDDKRKSQTTSTRDDRGDQGSSEKRNGPEVVGEREAAEPLAASGVDEVVCSDAAGYQTETTV